MDENQELNQELPKKRRAVEVTLSNGETLLIQAPKAGDMAIFINSLPALTALENAVNAAQAATNGVIGVPVNLSAETMESLFPLMAKMSGLSVEELKELDMWDGFAVFSALAVIMPKNLPAPTVRG